MKRSTFLLHIIYVTLLLSTSCLAQSVNKLEQNEFDTDILNHWWACEDKVNKSECDMRIFLVKTVELELNCVNWANGFSGSKCTYSLILQNDFLELTVGICGETINPGFIYGYLSGANLYILTSNKKLSLGSNLLAEKDWHKFERIKR